MYVGVCYFDSILTSVWLAMHVFHHAVWQVMSTSASTDNHTLSLLWSVYSYIYIHGVLLAMACAVSNVLDVSWKSL